MGEYILVIDEGTTSTRAIAFDREMTPIATAQDDIPLAFPQDGWVEQDPDTIWTKTLNVCRKVVKTCGGVEKFAGIGLTNQRETTLLWDKDTGKAFGPAIVWQDRRTAKTCDALKAKGREREVQGLTGLLLDPYFSATKIAWILEHNAEAHNAAVEGRAAFGTVDSFLLSRLTSGKTHATDVTNASRTLLMDLPSSSWSTRLCQIFGIPWSLLPDIMPSGGDYGETDHHLFGKPLPILSVIGDQQAALVGQACIAPGEAKITYGTGAFLVANTGTEISVSKHRLLATSAYQAQGRTHWALEGSIFNAGTVVKWLRDELKLISDASESEAMAAKLDDNAGIYFVPAFTGLGAPHWRSDARGNITGLHRGARAEHIVRAGLEATAYQTRDLLTAFEQDGSKVDTLRVDGGMAQNDWLMQFLADITGCTVERPPYPEMTATGAAVLAAGELGWMTLEDWHIRRHVEKSFSPQMDEKTKSKLLDGWQAALNATIETGRQHG